MKGTAKFQHRGWTWLNLLPAQVNPFQETFSPSMNIPTSNQRLDHLMSTLWTYRFWWLAPAVAGLVLASTYALFFRAENWTARQSFIVRDDLLGQAYKPGRFESQESMKSAQETILEISRRPQVIRNALIAIGPESGNAGADGSWVTDEMIEDTQGEISLSAPNGAEFGKTEVIVLTAKASSRERARNFIEALSKEIVTKTNLVRTARLQSMEAELLQGRDGAVREQRRASEMLQALDQLLGPDVGVMNALNDAQAGDTPMKREILQIKTDKRALEIQLETAQTTLRSLFRVLDNADEIVFLSSNILRQQPALERLKNELVLLQTRHKTLLGANYPSHPGVRAAELAVEMMEKQIHDSLVGEISGVQADIELKKNQLKRLNGDIGKLEQRLITLSEKRSDHLRLTAEVRQLTEEANKAKSALAEIQSLIQSDRSAGLLTPVDEPQVPTRPDGIGRKIVAASGAFGGLLVGLGVVLLIAPPMEPDPEHPDHRSPTSSPAATRSAGLGENTSTSPGLQGVTSAMESASYAIEQAAAAMQTAATMPRTNSLSSALEKSAQPSTANPQPQPAQRQPQPAQSRQPNSTAGAQQQVPPVAKSQPQVQPVAQRPAQSAPTNPVPQTRPASVPQRQPPQQPTGTQRPVAPPAQPVATAPAPTQRPAPSPVQTAPQAVAKPAPTSTAPARPATAVQPTAPKPTEVPVRQKTATATRESAPTVVQEGFQPVLPEPVIPPTRSTARPVDLVRSAEKEVEFVQSPTQVERAIESSQASAGKPANPFLSDRAKTPSPQQPPKTAPQPSKPIPTSTSAAPVTGSRKPVKSVPPRQSQPTPSAPSSKPSVSERPLTFSDLRPSEGTESRKIEAPVPEQIRRLTQSISRYTRSDEE